MLTAGETLCIIFWKVMLISKGWKTERGTGRPMKSNRVLSIISLILAVPMAAAALYGGFTAQNRPAKLLWSEPGVKATAEALVETLSAGNFAQGSQYLRGNPQLLLPEEEPGAGGMLWVYYRQHLRGELTGEPYLSTQGYCQNALFTVPDLDGLTLRMKEIAPELVTQRIVQAQELSEIYNEDYSFREDLISEILVEAAYSAIAEGIPQKQYPVQLRLVYQNDRWQVLPDQPLLDILAGKMENGQS